MGGTPAKGGLPAPNGEIGWGGIHTYAPRPRGRAMWSTFERRPGRGFGVNNLKHPHTLANQENETVSGGCSASARLSASCSGRCTPLSGVRRRDTLATPDGGHFGAAPEFRGRP